MEDEESPSGDGTVQAVKREITNVETIKQRIKARLHGSSRFEDRDGVIIDEVFRAVRSGEQRAADRSIDVLAARGGPDVGARLDHLEKDHRDLVGKSGEDGKIGVLRNDVKSLRAALIAIGLAVLGGVGASAKALYTAGEMRGAERTEFERMRITVDSLVERQDEIRTDLLRLRYGIPLAIPSTPGDL